ncbi:hypothetical protein GSI_04907 [Ganoderma sinense ZZ0214-1]|uniref:Transporter n=1 Tax=Ganoderma sinense ZZ0214-1 TaxID=1077348 RepID=A0A2G8SG89_9APHY|nr:hypothetical protein GSI_04907 [Ganoderma sinense ZZ0214-1]
MPAFQRLLVLSALALSLSVQAAPFEAVESREFDQATDLEARGFRRVHPGPHHGVTTHIGIPAQGHDHVAELEARRVRHKYRPHSGHKSTKDKHTVEAPAPTEEARAFEDDDVAELEARGIRHKPRPHSGHKSTKDKHTVEAPAPTEEARAFEDDVAELEARGIRHKYHPTRATSPPRTSTPLRSQRPPRRLGRSLTSTSRSMLFLTVTLSSLHHRSPSTSLSPSPQV